MLVITIEGEEIYNEETNEFSTIGDLTLELEHSLVSLSKWESKWQIPFLGDNEKTEEQLFDYVNCMILTPNAPPDVLSLLKQKHVNIIQEYIQSPQTATTFRAEPPSRGRGEIITSELIYYWMSAFQIPMECQYWHLNRLFTLIRIANIKNSKDKKMPKHEIARQNRELNARRREQLGTSG